MAYRIPKVSPSALAATELCPRYRSNGEENDAALEGTLLHKCLEDMVDQPIDMWESWITAQEVSVEHKGLLEEAAAQVRGILAGTPLPVFKDYRLRLRAGKPRKTPLKAGLYPECEVERGQGRHGYIDLMIVMPDGFIVVVDYKMVRDPSHDYTLQLGAYASDIHRLCPAHELFECRIVAPRLKNDAIDVHRWGLEDLKFIEERIANIEKRADDAICDNTILGHPSDACQYCRWAGSCPYQAGATLEVAKVTGIISKVMIPDGPYAGEKLTVQTFTAPSSPKQRGLRRACIKFLKSAAKEWEENDKKWAAETRDQQTGQRLVEVPGWSIGWNKGKSTLDRSREPEIHQAIMSSFNMPIEQLFSLCEVQVDKLVEDVVRNEGLTDKAAKEKVNRILDPFMTTGAGYPVWRQAGTKKTAKTSVIDV